MNKISVVLANSTHIKYVYDILRTIEESAKVRGTGIARRRPEYIESKINEGKAIIALDGDEFIGFCYIESWSHGKFVANSGLIVKPEYRGHGIAKKIKEEIFKLSRKKYPDAKIFGLTTGLAVMKINTSLRYRPVTFSELTDDTAFWEGCQSCVNYDILQRTNRKICLCTGMLYDPAWENAKIDISSQPQKRKHSLAVYGRWFDFKYHVLSHLKTKLVIPKNKRKAA
ncbi:MAG: GNAT family N-acetyltransferase [Bacteroidales bacterium]